MKTIIDSQNISSHDPLKGIKWSYSARLLRMVMKLAVKYYLRFNNEHPTSLPEPKDKKYLLYLHIPFCVNLCPYCSFHRFQLHEETARKYFELLRKEMHMAADLGYDFNSAYFGGGTTTILPDELAKTIDLARGLFSIKDISCETDPDHINNDNLKYTIGRIDRLSVGIQTFNNTHLKHIGRLAKFGTGEEQFRKVQEIIEHFPIVNVDMIYNFPGQTKEELLTDIETVKKLAPHQITFYPLMYAPFAGKKLASEIGKPRNETEAEFYKLLSMNIKEPYIQRTSWTYETTDSGMIDEYIVGNDEYLGLGSGAFSFLDGKLYANSFSLKEYAEKVSAGKPSISKSTSFHWTSIKKYRMMIEMFGLNGNPVNKPIGEYYAMRLMGAVKNENGTLVVTPKGRFLLSVMMKQFYNGMDYIREYMRKDLTIEDERIL